MSQATINEDLYVGGNLACKSIALPAGSVTDAAVQANAGIEATKVVHQFAKELSLPAGVNIASQTNVVHQVFPAGAAVSKLAGFLVSVLTPPGSPDTITVDLQRSTGGGAFATVLSAPITISSSTTPRVPQSASFAVTDLNNDDLLQIVVTYNHTSGTAGQGLLAEVFLRENPQ